MKTSDRERSDGNRSVFKQAMKAHLLLGIAAIAVLALPAPAPALPPTGDGSGGVRLNRIGNFEEPVHVAQPPGARNRDLLFVVEKEGRVMVIRKGKKLARPFLDIRNRVRTEGEEGLLSIAFHPNYVKNRTFYVYFTNNSGDNEVVEFRRRRHSRVRAEALARSDRDRDPPP